MRTIEPSTEGDRASIRQRRALFILCEKLLTVFFHDQAKLLRRFRLEQQQGAVIRQGFEEPLIAVTFPGQQIAPPLVRRLVSDDVLAQNFRDRTHVQPGLFVGRKEGKAGEENERWPTLTDLAGHLGQSQAGVGIWTKAVSEELDRPRRRVCHSLGIARGRRWGRGNGDLRGPPPRERRGRLRRRGLRRTLRERAFHAGCGIRFHRNVAGLGRYPRVLAQVESSNRHGTIGNPMAGLLTRRQIGGRIFDSPTGGKKRPAGRIAELQIESGHLQPAVGIPRPTGPDVE